MNRTAGLALAIAAGLSLGAAGCTVTAPTTPFSQQGKDSGDQQQQPQQQLTGGQDMAGPTVVHAPVLGSYDRTTSWTTTPIHGTADPNVTILVTSANGSVVNASTDASGNFCQDVSLVANQVNTFTVEAVSSNGVHSAQVTATVTQQGSAGTTAPTPTATNVAIGTSASAYYIGTSSEAPAQQIVDGDPSTSLEDLYDDPNFWFWETAPNPYLIVQLKAATPVNQIIAIMPSDCDDSSGNPPQLFYTTSTAPPPATTPAAGMNGWVVATASVGADKKTYTAKFAQANVTYVAAVFTTTTGPSEGLPLGAGGCTEGGDDTGYIGLAELQAWSVPNAPPPPPVAPTCGGGG